MSLNLFVAKRNRSGSHGPVRRLLRRLGPSWATAPLRRILQAISLVAFIALLWVGSDLFCKLDPLASISAAIAGRMWTPALVPAAIVLGVCLIFPRGFCGYLCPLGATIDMFDWVIGRRVRNTAPKARPRWSSIRFALLAIVLAAAGCGVMLGGFVTALPLLTRGITAGFLPVTAIQIAAIALLVIVLVLGLAGRRFWCRFLCPTGALLSLASWLRLTRRKTTDDCTQCGACVKVCDFDAIHEDFATRDVTCTFCQTCGGACPTGAIGFVARWNDDGIRPQAKPASKEASTSRRTFLVGTVGGLALATGLRKLWGAVPNNASLPVRPPGALPETKFLAACVRCGACQKACPTGLLQPAGWDNGLEGLWTPQALAEHGLCEADCNRCGLACPTGAIRKLELPEKQALRMGRAEINKQTCLSHTGQVECGRCGVACKQAGHEAIEPTLVGIEFDEMGEPDPETGWPAPSVIVDKCVGCGACQNVCHSVNVRQERLLKSAAIVVSAGAGKDDRIVHGSYIALRQAERQAKRRRLNASQDVPYYSD